VLLQVWLEAVGVEQVLVEISFDLVKQHVRGVADDLKVESNGRVGHLLHDLLSHQYDSLQRSHHFVGDAGLVEG
jgi:hypothetical protein